MAHGSRLWIAVVGAATAAIPPLALAQQSSPTSSSPTTQTSPVDDLHQQIKDKLNECDADINVRGDFQHAADCAQQARELSRRTGDKSSEAMALVYLGAALGYQGRVNEAYDEGKETLAVAQASGDKRVLEEALNNLASVAGGLGRYEESVATFYACLDIARQINDSVMEYISLLNVGEAYTRAGEPDRAEGPLKEALKLAGELDHGDEKSKARAKKGTEMALLNLAAVEVARGHYAAALRYFEQVHASQPSTPLWAISALQGMANVNRLLGRPQEAIPLFEQALALAEKSDGAQIAAITSDLGMSQDAAGKLDAALASESKALNMVHASGGDRDAEWQMESHIGHVLRAMGRNEEALGHYQASIAGIEDLRSVALNTEEGRAGVLAKSHDTYTETANLLVDLHRDADAFAVAERGRGRAFLDMLVLSRGGLPDDLTPEQEKREQALVRKVSAAQKALWQEGLTAKEEQQHKSELSSAEDDLDAFRTELRHSNSRYASIRYPEPVDVGRIQKELLDEKTVLAEFLLGEKRSLVWIVSRNSATVVSLPPRAKIETEIAEYRRLLSEKTSALTLDSSLEKIQLQGTALYKALLAPAGNSIPSGSTLIIVPDGPLNYLPFETLIAGSKRDKEGAVRPTYALEQYSIAYAPSASALLTVRAMNSTANGWDKTLLAFGDPVVGPQVQAESAPAAVAVRAAYDKYAERGLPMTRLPFTREEVLSIAHLFPSPQDQLYLGASATEEAVQHEDLTRYRYIHFATHGFFDETAPYRSGILFSRNPASHEIGVLQAGDIMRLRLNADLVTLSACSTGLGQLVSGEGLLGLTRAFFYAGARNLTVSLWNVNDSATSTLMRDFYLQLNRGTSKSEALRRAKLELLNGADRTWRAPFYWGAFVLVGDGK